MVNRTTSFAPSALVYTKIPNHTSDLIDISQPSSQVTNNVASRIVDNLKQVQNNLAATNDHYKLMADRKRRHKMFKEGDLVMIHLKASIPYWRVL